MTESKNLAQKNLTFSITEKLFRALLTFINLSLIARFMGPTNYGHLNYLISLATFFQLFGVFGLEQVIIREIHLFDKKFETLFWDTTKFKIILSLFSFAGYSFYLWSLGDLTWLNALFGLIVFSAVFDNARVFLESKNRHSLIAKAEMSYQIVSTVIKIVLIFLKVKVAVLFGVFVLDYFLTKIYYFLVIRDEVKTSIKEKFIYKRFKYFYKLGVFHFMSSLSAIVYMKIDQVMIGQMINLKTLGSYSSAVRLSDSWYFIPTTISSVFFPLILSRVGEEKRNYLQLVFDLSFWTSVGVIIFLFIFGENVYGLLFGGGYSIDKEIFYLLVSSGLFVSLGLSSGVWLNLNGHNFIVFIRTFIGAVLNIILNLALIPRWGALGCAFATLVSYLIAFLVTFFAPNSKECFSYILKSINIGAATRRTLPFILKIKES